MSWLVALVIPACIVNGDSVVPKRTGTRGPLETALNVDAL